MKGWEIALMSSKARHAPLSKWSVWLIIYSSWSGGCSSCDRPSDHASISQTRTGWTPHWNSIRIVIYQSRTHERTYWLNSASSALSHGEEPDATEKNKPARSALVQWSIVGHRDGRQRGPISSSCILQCKRHAMVVRICICLRIVLISNNSSFLN